MKGLVEEISALLAIVGVITGAVVPGNAPAVVWALMALVWIIVARRRRKEGREGQVERLEETTETTFIKSILPKNAINQPSAMPAPFVSFPVSPTRGTPQVTAVVHGGLVQAIYTNRPEEITCEVVDLDMSCSPDEKERNDNVEKESYLETIRKNPEFKAVY